MVLYTQFTYEKKWIKISTKDALRMIADEMPEADAEGTLSYIVSEVSKGKTITLGGCRFTRSHFEGSNLFNFNDSDSVK